MASDPPVLSRDINTIEFLQEMSCLVFSNVDFVVWQRLHFPRSMARAFFAMTLAIVSVGVHFLHLGQYMRCCSIIPCLFVWKTSMEYRHVIMHLYEHDHLSEREIARQLGLSPSTVHYWIQRRGQKADTKPGRPRVTNPQQDQTLYDTSTREPFLSAVDLQKAIVPSCSADTVRNRLKEKGLKCRIPARKPFLTPHHRQMRFVYALRHINWTMDLWERVVFSDEKIFRSTSRGALRVYRPKHGSDRYDDKYLVHSSNPAMVGTPRFTICVWMAFGKHLRRLLRVEQRTLNAQYYTTQILPSIEDDVCENDFIFMQDLSSIHTSRMTIQWLRDRNIIVMDDWPPKGPDMNPVENVWGELVRRIEKKKTGVRNRDELWDDILQAFHELPDEYFDRLIASMPKRVALVATKHGGWTKY